MEKRIFVISDLHGQFVLLQLLLDRIGFNDNDELYILGDIMDRGPNSIDIIHHYHRSEEHTSELQSH